MCDTQKVHSFLEVEHRVRHAGFCHPGELTRERLSETKEVPQEVDGVFLWWKESRNKLLEGGLDEFLKTELSSESMELTMALTTRSQSHRVKQDADVAIVDIEQLTQVRTPMRGHRDRYTSRLGWSEIMEDGESLSSESRKSEPRSFSIGRPS